MEDIKSIDWTTKTILLTGGTGSFGKHFCRLMLKNHPPKAIRIYSRDELKQHEMRQEFGEQILRFFIGDIRDLNRLRRAMEGVDYVIHAAALKHVPICEYNPIEAIKTNILGAQNVVNASIDAGVKKIVALSTDKAVNPVNLYGATKLCAEKLFVYGNAYAGPRDTRFSCVRYGNVIASRGSVIPLFLKQKKEKKLTITDERMTRFWITLDQAVNLVLKAFELMRGGEIFVPKIPSLRIMDLAKAVCPDCEIEFIGIRPGEKLHESLTTSEEARHMVSYEDMYIIYPERAFWGGNRPPLGEPVKDDFVYTSDTNTKWMTIDEMHDIINKLESEKLLM